jgi:hypothetical protein
VSCIVVAGENSEGCSAYPDARRDHGPGNGNARTSGIRTPDTGEKFVGNPRTTCPHDLRE